MRVKTMLLATFSAGLGMWLIAALWHNLIMASFYKNLHATHDGIALLLVAYVILALIMSYLYPLIYQGDKPVLEGLKFGMIIGVLWVFPHGLAMAGAHGDSIVYVFKNGAWHMIEQGIGGIIIALMYRSKKSV